MKSLPACRSLDSDTSIFEESIQTSLRTSSSNTYKSLQIGLSTNNSKSFLTVAYIVAVALKVVVDIQDAVTISIIRIYLILGINIVGNPA